MREFGYKIFKTATGSEDLDIKRRDVWLVEPLFNGDGERLPNEEIKVAALNSKFQAWFPEDTEALDTVVDHLNRWRDMYAEECQDRHDAVQEIAQLNARISELERFIKVYEDKAIIEEKPNR